MKKVDPDKYYQCRSCEDETFKYKAFDSYFDFEYGGYRNLAYGACEKCGFEGEHQTVNDHREYKNATTV